MGEQKQLAVSFWWRYGTDAMTPDSIVRRESARYAVSLNSSITPMAVVRSPDNTTNVKTTIGKPNSARVHNNCETVVAGQLVGQQQPQRPATAHSCTRRRPDFWAWHVFSEGLVDSGGIAGGAGNSDDEGSLWMYVAPGPEVKHERAKHK